MGITFQTGPPNDWLFEVTVASGPVLVFTLVVGNQELVHVLNCIERTPGLDALRVRCIEVELNLFLHECYQMDAVIEE